MKENTLKMLLILHTNHRMRTLCSAKKLGKKKSNLSSVILPSCQNIHMRKDLKKLDLPPRPIIRIQDHRPTSLLTWWIPRRKTERYALRIS